MEEGRILVIDDSWVILERVRAALSAKGYDVRTTTETVGAAKHLRTCDLVVIDFHMPGMNGQSVLASLRKSVGTQTACAFYLYTSDPEVAGRFVDYGFDGSFLRKGDEEALVPQVNAAFRTIRMRKLAKKMKDERSRG